MDRFSKLHPVVLFLFYIIGISILLIVNNPFFSAVSLVCSVLYCVRLKGTNIIKSLEFVAIVLIFVSFFNMLFAHYGIDVLFSVKDTDFTLEALFYGFNQGMVLSAVLLWFDAFSRTFDSEKVIYVFRFTPKLALIFSMVLGFVPRFTKKLGDIRDAQLGLNGGESPKGFKNKLQQGMNNLSALVTYSLESSIITADSMQARGYNQRAVRKSRYNFKIIDAVILVLISGLCGCIVVIKSMGGIRFIFEPEIYSESFSIVALLCFMVLQLLPTLIDLWEDIIWKLSSARA